jgi:hypothetical protein
MCAPVCTIHVGSGAILSILTDLTVMRYTDGNRAQKRASIGHLGTPGPEYVVAHLN